MMFQLNRCRKRSHLAEELVEEVWLDDHRSPQFSSAVEDAISECLDLTGLLRRVWNSSRAQLFHEEIDDIDSAYLAMLNSIDRALGASKRLEDLAASLEEQSIDVHVADLRIAVSQLQELRGEVEATWPVVDETMINESLAAYRRGEYQTAEDLLRVAQGHSPEDSQ